ncbi:hypothetical protein F4083_02310 [Candidatus Poribacteria bacterium]|nr:hypothetical protein [Candidatus Poribacteria bacterium]MYI93143.1 hypothetical protein [Candidatus Poribacteria bacterium]
MFVKISENRWINLIQCESIEIEKKESYNWEIVFSTVRSDSIGRFRFESEAHEVLDEIWESYREGKPYFEPDPRKKMNVRLGDKWYADDEPIQTYFDGLQLLGLEEIEARGLTFKDRNTKDAKEYPVVTKDRVPRLQQSDADGYYILKLERLTSMKETLERVASELGVDIEVTIY